MFVNNFMDVSNAKSLLVKKCEKFDEVASRREQCSVKRAVREEIEMDVSVAEVLRW